MKTAMKVAAIGSRTTTVQSVFDCMDRGCPGLSLLETGEGS